MSEPMATVVKDWSSCNSRAVLGAKYAYLGCVYMNGEYHALLRTDSGEHFTLPDCFVEWPEK